MSEFKRSPERERLLDSVNQIAPVLEACAPEAEALRHLPQRAVDVMQEAGLFRCAAPGEVGGLGVDLVTQVEVFEATTAAESNAGWNLMIGAIWAGLLGGKLPEEGAHAVFGGDGWPIPAGLVFPFGRAHSQAEGKYVLDGRWRFASGINQAAWVASGCTIFDGDAPRLGPGGTPILFIAVVPKNVVTVEDTWHVAGLKGTGSCDYRIENVPVGDGFIIEGMTSSAYRGGTLWRLPGPLLTTPGHTGFALGIARRCLDEVKAIGDRRRYLSPSSQAERETVQMELGRRRAEYEAVRLLAFDYLARVTESAERGEVPGFEPINAYATEVAVRCAEFAYKTMGGDAVFVSSPVQRYLRDVLAAQQHVAASDSGFVRYGRETLQPANR